MTTGNEFSDSPIEDGYRTNAQYWIDVVRNRSDRFQQELTDPALLEAIGNCNDLDILDAGCGEGTFTHRLLELGAATVHGVDSCWPLIQAARAEFTAQGDGRATFSYAKVESMPLAAASTDLVVANRIPHALENPEQRFHEFARVLRPGGRLVLLSQHPCFYSSKAERSLTRSTPDVSAYFQRRVIRQHFSVAGKTSPAPSVQPLYSLEAYIAMIVAAGLSITDLREPHPTAEQMRDPWWTANFTRPLFLLLTCAR